ncbi:MAG: peptidyl-prolyl cis-trans isomerase [Clostridiales bacterium]|nr:peptidyl-prolyl cis-trans isomerase [Clostridiales bacterium]
MGKKHQKKEPNKNNLQEQMLEHQQNGKKKSRKRSIVLCTFIVAAAILAFVLWLNRFVFYEPADVKAFQVGENMVYMDEVNFCILESVLDLEIDAKALEENVAEDMTADEFYKQNIMNAIMDYKVEEEMAKREGLVLTKEEKEQANKDVISFMETVDGGVLRELGITRDTIVEVYQQRYLAQKLETQVTENLEAEEVSYCTMYMLMFPKIKMDADGNYVKDEDTGEPIMLSDEEISKRKAEADTAYEELKSGADIEELAKKYGIESFSGEESNTPESFGEPFSDYAKTLKEGEVSPVLDISSCYVVLKMMNPNNKEMAEQIRGYYRNDLAQKTIEENKTKWYDEIGVSQDETWTSAAWKKVTLYDFVGYVEE